MESDLPADVGICSSTGCVCSCACTCGSGDGTEDARAINSFNGVRKATGLVVSGEEGGGVAGDVSAIPRVDVRGISIGTVVAAVVAVSSLSPTLVSFLLSAPKSGENIISNDERS